MAILEIFSVLRESNNLVLENRACMLSNVTKLTPQATYTHKCLINVMATLRKKEN